jgi:group I intron endonuclease
MVGVVYKISNSINGKIYIGQTTRLLRIRFSEHCTRDKGQLRNAINKYGRENFHIEVLCECSSIDELNKKEEFFIESMNTLKPNGYNLLRGGRNKIPLDSTRKKLSDAHKGEKHHYFGKKRDPNVGLAISRAQKGLVRSKESKELASFVMKEHWKNHPHPMKGKKFTEHEKEKMSKSRTGIKFTQERKDKISAGLRKSHAARREKKEV